MRKNILGETSLYQSIGKITRKWEDCGVVSDCEELVGVTWRLSDCEELVGVTHRR
mgnify:CR=1 FL=1